MELAVHIHVLCLCAQVDGVQGLHSSRPRAKTRSTSGQQRLLAERRCLQGRVRCGDRSITTPGWRQRMRMHGAPVRSDVPEWTRAAFTWCRGSKARAADRFRAEGRAACRGCTSRPGLPAQRPLWRNHRRGDGKQRPAVAHSGQRVMWVMTSAVARSRPQARVLGGRGAGGSCAQASVV